MERLSNPGARPVSAGITEPSVYPFPKIDGLNRDQNGRIASLTKLTMAMSPKVILA